MVYDYVFCCNDCTVHIGHNGRRSDYCSSHRDFTGKRQLLHVSRLVHHEAKPLLYAGHNFVFDAMKSFNAFMAGAQTSRHLIKSLQINKSGLHLSSECYRLLLDTTKLQSFTITLPSHFKGTLRQHLDKHWQYLILYLLGKSATEELSFHRLSIIRFRVGPGQTSVSGSDGGPLQLVTPEMNDGCQAYLKRKLKKLLEGAGET